MDDNRIGSRMDNRIGSSILVGSDLSSKNQSIQIGCQNFQSDQIQLQLNITKDCLA